MMTEAWKTDLPTSRKIVFLALCDNANDHGERALREERDKVRFLTELLHGKAAA